VRDLDAFARRDGFADLADMSSFWLHHHGDANFDGVVIEWARLLYAPGEAPTT
jgi:hypothetical protein